jgi:hypothetical protein
MRALQTRLSYEAAKKNPKEFVSLTSLFVEEFDALCTEFQEDWWKHYRYYTLKGEVRKHLLSENRDNTSLPGTEDKLFFLLVCLKNNSQETLIGASFGLSVGKVNEWKKLLTRILTNTLKRLHMLPVRDGDLLYKVLKKRQIKTINLDATERCIQRPRDHQVQQDYYSGKRKCHTEKNNVIADDDQRILYLSPTYEGKVHDKAICDQENCHYPEGIELRQDSGYIGHRPQGVNIVEPTKKPKGKVLSKEKKEENKSKSKLRVVIEHVMSGIKRCRIVKEVQRSWRIEFRDQLMWICCGLHNLSVSSPFRGYQKDRAIV